MMKEKKPLIVWLERTPGGAKKEPIRESGRGPVAQEETPPIRLNGTLATRQGKQPADLRVTR